MAIGLALSPLPVLSFIVVLLTEKARQNSLSFIAGWMLGIALVGGITLILPVLSSMGSRELTTVDGWVRFGLGCLLAIGSLKEFSKRTRAGRPPHVPKIVSRLDKIGLWQSGLAGMVMSTVNLKNAMFVAAGTSVILSQPVSPANKGIFFIIFTLLGSSLLYAITVVFYLSGRHAQVVLSRWRHWLTHNFHLVMAILLLCISLILFYHATLIAVK